MNGAPRHEGALLINKETGLVEKYTFEKGTEGKENEGKKQACFFPVLHP
jgi:hypothetical protein